MQRSFVETVARHENFFRRGSGPFVALQSIENNLHLHITSLGIDLQAAVNYWKQIATVDMLHIQRNSHFICICSGYQ